MNAGYWIGWLAGMALSSVIAIMLPALGFLGGVLVGFGLSQTCAFIGMAAWKR